MIKPEQVPKEAADAVWALISKGDFTSTEDAIAAALNAWPGWEGSWDEANGLRRVIILPLPQEPRDE